MSQQRSLFSRLKAGEVVEVDMVGSGELTRVSWGPRGPDARLTRHGTREASIFMTEQQCWEWCQKLEALAQQRREAPTKVERVKPKDDAAMVKNKSVKNKSAKRK